MEGRTAVRPSGITPDFHAAFKQTWYNSTQDSSWRLVAGQESVRREMADYLHGHVQSKLLALSLSLGLCQQSLIRDPAAASLIL